MLDSSEVANELDSIDKENLNDPKDMQKWTFFKAGWRPALGWLSVIIVFYSFIIHPIIVWYALLHGFKIALPLIDATALLNLVGIVVGIGAMRTYEKVRFNETRERRSRFSRLREEDDIYN